MDDVDIYAADELARLYIGWCPHIYVSSASVPASEYSQARSIMGAALGAIADASMRLGKREARVRLEGRWLKGGLHGLAIAAEALQAGGYAIGVDERVDGARRERSLSISWDAPQPTSSLTLPWCVSSSIDLPTEAFGKDVGRLPSADLSHARAEKTSDTVAALASSLVDMFILRHGLYIYFRDDGAAVIARTQASAMARRLGVASGASWVNGVAMGRGEPPISEDGKVLFSVGQLDAWARSHGYEIGCIARYERASPLEIDERVGGNVRYGGALVVREL